MPCFTAMRAEIALMSGSAFAVTHHAFSSGAGRASDGNGSHASTLKSPSYTKSVSWQHYLRPFLLAVTGICRGWVGFNHFSLYWRSCNFVGVGDWF
ncbi:transposase [Shigella dysenteriae 225-75]|nr:transposase [Shigella dysenteriae 225-75]